MTENPDLGPEAVVSLNKITEQTVRQICKLSDTLSEQQQKMVADYAAAPLGPKKQVQVVPNHEIGGTPQDLVAVVPSSGM